MGTELVLAHPLGRGKADICVLGLLRTRTMFLLNSSDLWQLNYRFSADFWVFILLCGKKNVLARQVINKELLNRPKHCYDRYQVSKCWQVFQKKKLLQTVGLNIVLLPFIIVVWIFIIWVWVQGLAFTHCWKHGFHCTNTNEHKPLSFLHQYPATTGKKSWTEWSERLRVFLYQNHRWIRIWKHHPSSQQPCKKQIGFPRSSLVLCPLNSTFSIISLMTEAYLWTIQSAVTHYRIPCSI